MKDIVYHVGDFSKKAESLYKLDTSRGTGYFGTGYYFTTEWEYCKSQGGGHRPLYSINISNYKLLKGTIDLHYALQDFNRYMMFYPYMRMNLSHMENFARDYEKFKYSVSMDYHNRHPFSEIFQEEFDDNKQYALKNLDEDNYTLLDFIKEEGSDFYYDVTMQSSDLEKEFYNLCDTSNPKWSKIDAFIENNNMLFDETEMNKITRYQYKKDRMISNLGVSDSKFESICEKIYKELEHFYEDGILITDNSTQTMDSIPTMFIKELGYDGVYPDEDCDNTTYGGVIYDLDLAKDVTLLSNDVGDYPNNALSNKLEESRFYEKSKKDVVYRAGDFSRKSEPLYSVQNGRETGFFGTGYYFTTEWESCSHLSGGHRPLYSIDISNYNLKYGTFTLHTALRNLNRYMTNYPLMSLDVETISNMANYYSELIYDLSHKQVSSVTLSEVIKEEFEINAEGDEDYTLLDELEYHNRMFIYYLKEIPELQELYELFTSHNPKWDKIDKIIETYEIYFDSDFMEKLDEKKRNKIFIAFDLGVNESKFDSICEDIYKKLQKFYGKDGVLKLDDSTQKMDSIPTMFLKALGYDGIYPSPECDNTAYGGVLYDLDLAKDITLLSKDASNYPENALAEPLKESLSFEQLKKEVVPESKANEHLNYFYKQRNKLNGQGNRNIKYVATEFNDKEGSMSFLFRTDSTYNDELKMELENDKLNDGDMIDNLSDEYALQLKICDFWDIFESLIVEGDKVFNKKDMESILSLSQEVRVGCSCPSSYWMGGDYWLSQIDAQLKDCTIKPKYWNQPQLRGETKVCKHLLSLLNHISFFLPQMAMGVKSELMTYGLF